MTDIARLEPFFSPGHIALAGASERGMYPSGILNNLLNYGTKVTFIRLTPAGKPSLA